MLNSGSYKDLIILQQHEPKLNSYERHVISNKYYRNTNHTEPV